jgi:hypothetical protein
MPAEKVFENSPYAAPLFSLMEFALLTNQYVEFIINFVSCPVNTTAANIHLQFLS